MSPRLADDHDRSDVADAPNPPTAGRLPRVPAWQSGSRGRPAPRSPAGRRPVRVRRAEVRRTVPASGFACDVAAPACGFSACWPSTSEVGRWGAASTPAAGVIRRGYRRPGTRPAPGAPVHLLIRSSAPLRGDDGATSTGRRASYRRGGLIEPPPRSVARVPARCRRYGSTAPRPRLRLAVVLR
jgi:hypothetical protein